MTGRESLQSRFLRLAKGESVGDVVFGAIITLVALVVLATFVGFLLVLVQRALPAILEFGLGFLWSQEWDPDGQRFGALPYMAGTLASSVLAVLIAVPVALGAAIALSELLPARVAALLGVLVELVAAIPSIIFGVWGLAVIVPWVAKLSGGQSFGRSILAAGLVLSVMILPIIAAIARDMVQAVPQAQREAALALGLTRWEVAWRVTLPYARGGISAAVVLGFGRAIGETMAVIMVIGNQPKLPNDLFDAGATIASVIANEFGDPSGPLHFSSLVELGLLLLLMSLAVNVTSRLVLRAWRRRLEGKAA